MTDREIFLNQAEKYIGKNGSYVCLTKLNIGFITHWCAFSVSAIMKDCGFIGKYIKQIEGGAGSVPRASVPAGLGEWFKKGTKDPQAGDLFFLRYANYPNNDKYFCDHIGIVKSFDKSSGRIITLEGNVDGTYNTNNYAATSTFKSKTRYLSNGDMYAFYRPYWKNEIKTTTTSATTSTQQSNTKTFNQTPKWSGYINNKISARIWPGDGHNVLKSIGALAINTPVDVCDSAKDNNGAEWYYIRINGKIFGFINAKYVSKSKIVIKTQNSSFNQTVKWYGTVTATDGLNVRTWAGTENSRLNSIPVIKYGTKVGICDSCRAKDGSTWYYIVINGNTYGFVHSAYIKKV